MNSEITVSVIVPVYKAEKYISKCLESIINQTYKNLEILIIDDYGEDNSISIVAKFAEKDRRIKILSYGENRGPSFARNTGISNATGDYITFIDSDDFIDNDYIEYFVKKAIETNCDVICNNNIANYYNDKSIKVKKSDRNKINAVFPMENDTFKLTSASANLKLYKKSFIDDNIVRFVDEIRVAEDLCFTRCLLVNTKEIYIGNGPRYYYRKLNNSITASYTKQGFDVLKACRVIYVFYSENKLLDRFSLPIGTLRHYFKKSCDKKIFYKEIKEFIKNIDFKEELYKKKERRFYNIVVYNDYITYLLETFFGLFI